MKFKGFWYDGLLIFLAGGIGAFFVALTAFVNPKLAISEGIAFLIICIFAVYRALSAKKRYKKFLVKTTKKLDFTDEKVLSNFPFPVAVCDEKGYITWCSGRFLNEISLGEITETARISDYTGNVSFSSMIECENLCVNANGKYYSVYSVKYISGGQKYIAFYFLDTTSLKETENEYINSRPYAVLVELDNLDDSRSDFRDSERAEIKSRIEAALDNWSELYNSVLKKISDDRYLIVTEKKNIDLMVEDRFSILQTVRNFEFKGHKTAATLSVGVSSGKDIKSCEKHSRKALEMALGRGGDQVAIRTKDGYDFIGGVSKSAEKRTKVKSRVVGMALSELIKSASNVIVMGHSFTDLDAIGAAVGIACAAQSFSVPVHIATDKKKTLAGSLIEKLEKEGMGNLVIGQDDASELISKKTLLVVVDTHIESFAEFPKLYEKATTRVIIDHHRRAVTDIESAVIFHHDPGASSACEMVTELLPYINPDIEISKTVAEALLAGIMLDTKDFVINAGVRTFEAAAYLKDKNADTVNVKKLFANSLEVNKLRTKVISAAETFMECAVSFADFSSSDIRIISAQAADELLKVKGVKASFVMFENSGAVNISARSLGEINVQIIMESLGGGGHQNMAACQLKGCKPEKAKTMLKEAIKDFYDKNSK